MGCDNCEHELDIHDDQGCMGSVHSTQVLPDYELRDISTACPCRTVASDIELTPEYLAKFAQAIDQAELEPWQIWYLRALHEEMQRQETARPIFNVYVPGIAR